MLNTIPISQIVSINPSVLQAAGAAIDLNGVIATKNPAIPIGTLKGFATAQDVADFFGATTDEAKAAAVYFNGYTIATKSPGLLYMAQYNLSLIHI